MNQPSHPAIIAGILFIAFGLVLLAEQAGLIDSIDWRVLMAIALMVLGVGVIVGGASRRHGPSAPTDGETSDGAGAG